MTRSLEAIVSEQVRRWELQRRQGLRARRRPCVAISRLPYAHGAQIATRVAEPLEFGLFDKEIVEKIAAQHGVQERLVASCDEQIRSAIDRFVTDFFRVGAFRESDYHREVLRTLRTLGERGRAVIVGRGAPWVLAADEALRVLVVAPTAVRAERLAKERGLTPERALEELEALDRRRGEFARKLFGVDQSDPTLYELVVNTGTLTLDEAADVVIEAFRRHFRD